jgi:hypothetical protein
VTANWYGSKLSWPNVTNCPRVCLEGLRRTKNLSVYPVCRPTTRAVTGLLYLYLTLWRLLACFCLILWLSLSQLCRVCLSSVYRSVEIGGWGVGGLRYVSVYGSGSGRRNFTDCCRHSSCFSMCITKISLLFPELYISQFWPVATCQFLLIGSQGHKENHTAWLEPIHSVIWRR